MSALISVELVEGAVTEGLDIVPGETSDGNEEGCDVGDGLETDVVEEAEGVPAENTFIFFIELPL